jgi:hypothetical protein
MYDETKEDLIESRKRNIAIEIIKCLDNLYEFTGESMLIQTTQNSNPLYYNIEISDRNGNKLGINIHKLK